MKSLDFSGVRYQLTIYFKERSRSNCLQTQGLPFKFFQQLFQLEHFNPSDISAYLRFVFSRLNPFRLNPFYPKTERKGMFSESIMQVGYRKILSN